VSPTSLSQWEATTSGGLRQPIRTAAAAFVLATSNFVATGTTAGMPLVRTTPSVSITSSGLTYSAEACRPARRTGTRLYELRRLTGLTWDEIARLFHVSRRSVFLWASGKPMSSDNETLLARLLAFVQGADLGSAGANRQMLLGSTPGGDLVIDLLAAGRVDEARASVGLSSAVPRRTPSPLSPDERRRREPPKPHELLGALREATPVEAGRVRSVRKAKSLRRS